MADPAHIDRLVEVIEEQSKTIDRQTELLRAQYAHMEWFRDETTKLMRAAGPMLSMMAPMLGQLMSGGSLPQALGVPTDPNPLPPTPAVTASEGEFYHG